MLRVLLRFQNKLRGQQRLFLILRDMRAIHDIADKLRTERQHNVVAIDIARLFLIDDK